MVASLKVALRLAAYTVSHRRGFLIWDSSSAVSCWVWKKSWGDRRAIPESISLPASSRHDVWLWARKGTPMDIHNILVPTDFSAYAAYALQQALVLAAREKAHVLLLHVLSRREMMWPEMVWPMRAQLVHELQDEAEQRLQAVAAAQPFPIATLALWGNPATEICRIAHEYGTDLIVMSTHGRTGLAHMFMGSITERVVRSAPCSVLIVRSFQLKEARVDQSSVLRYLDQHSTEEPVRWEVRPYLAVPCAAGVAHHLVSAEGALVSSHDVGAPTALGWGELGIYAGDRPCYTPETVGGRSVGSHCPGCGVVGAPRG